MDELKKWQMINGCETFEQLFTTIDNILAGDTIMSNNGIMYDADKLKRSVSIAIKHKNYCYVTRRYGLRQQVMYLDYYENGMV